MFDRVPEINGLNASLSIVQPIKSKEIQNISK
jgi:hypothetical protein